MDVNLLLRAAAVVLVVGTLGACSNDDSSAVGSPGTVVTEIPESSQTPDAPETPDTPDTPDETDGLSACDEVVAGIDAFNRGELDETVAAFERAIPLAEAEDAEAGTELSGALLEAVRYYAALPAEEYPVASVSSPDFAKYKAITLGQCASEGQLPAPDGGDGGGIQA